MTTQVVPILRVADAEVSVEWYARIGFEQVFEHRFDEGMPAYVGLEREGALIHLSEHTGDAPGPGLLYIWVDEIDPLAEHFGVVPDEMPWARDFEVTDPDGNRIRLAEAVG
ncbi:glyoxalase superfamily protein [Ilumatobacter nonamiensis]|uniref:glyoxalase superfamily protein n=1 Tax=Ilumatobacter nonamiensis TaxID=467093 RepID=UPI00058EF187|nr:glyoxalase superfamily protein [Ilumatobacter nonamiensis]